MKDVTFGALTQLYAGTSPEGKDFNGKVHYIFVTLHMFENPG